MRVSRSRFLGRWVTILHVPAVCACVCTGVQDVLYACVCEFYGCNYSLCRLVYVCVCACGVFEKERTRARMRVLWCWVCGCVCACVREREHMMVCVFVCVCECGKPASSCHPL